MKNSGFILPLAMWRSPLLTDCWEESWLVLYQKQLAHMIKLDEENHDYGRNSNSFAR